MNNMCGICSRLLQFLPRVVFQQGVKEIQPDGQGDLILTLTGENRYG